MHTSETRQKTFEEIEKEEGTDAAIEAGILSDPDALYFQDLEEAEIARVAKALRESEDSSQSFKSKAA
jgi:hypothetical protein